MTNQEGLGELAANVIIFVVAMAALFGAYRCTDCTYAERGELHTSAVRGHRVEICNGEHWVPFKGEIK